MNSKFLILAASATALLAACGAEKSDTQPTEPEAAPLADPVAEPDTTASTKAMDTEQADTMAEVPDAVRTAQAHVHGDAKLALVLDGSSLTIELDSPLYNLTGFEHTAETDEQRATVEAAEAALNAPESLFAFNADAACTASAEELDIHLASDGHEEEDDHEHEDSDDHDHDDEHSDDDAHDHDKDEHSTGEDYAEEDHEAHGHKDVVISYSFTCANPDSISPITVNLFDKFPNMAELEVVYLGPNTQDLFTLTPANTTINLRP